MSLSLFREDLEKQSQGSPCYINQMTFHVKRIGTKESQAEIKDIKEKLYGPIPNPKEIDENFILANWLAYCGVLGWDDVADDESGEVIEFSPAEARKIFLNESYYLSLNQAILNHAMNFENYLCDESEKEIENIKKK